MRGINTVPAEPTLHILLVDDEETDALLAERALRRAGYAVNAHRVDSAAALEAVLTARPWDLILCDYSMPRFSGLDALALVRRRGLDVPFILLSGAIGEETAVAALKAGADDYVMKGNPARLIPSVQRALREVAEHRQRRRAEEALRFQARLLETVGQAIVATDVAGVITYWNSAAEALYGWTADEAVGRNILSILRTEPCHPSDPETLTSLMNSGPISGEYLARHRSGRMIPILASSVPLRDERGEIVGVIGVSNDVSTRVQAEQAIARHVEQLSALRANDMAIMNSVDLHITLDILLAQVIAQLRVDAAQVLILDQHTQTLKYAAGRGFRGLGVSRLSLRLGEGHAGRAALEGRRISVPDLAQEEVTRLPLLTEEQFVSYVGAPLIAKGQVRGVLEVFHRRSIATEEAWLDYLETLAGQVAIAIDNATLFSDLQRANIELMLAYDTTIEGWSRALDLRDRETEGHSRRVTTMTMALAEAMGLTGAELVQVRRGALLHDIGKMGIPDAILLKPGPLTEDEWVLMRKHPVYAYELLAPISYLRPALYIPYSHHEKWDGTGYPRGLVGEQIPLAARIFAVVDVWDALCSDRPYRKGWPARRVREHLAAGAGTHFDPEVVAAFLEMEWPRRSDERTEAG
jgi:PAS domain S-box-containing protein/putative nucleotidyltransferase with HDIG domain